MTRDSDYLDLSALHGQPPKIVWLRTGNQTKAAVIHLLLKSKDAIEENGGRADLWLSQQAAFDLWKATPTVQRAAVGTGAATA